MDIFKLFYINNNNNVCLFQDTFRPRLTHVFYKFILGLDAALNLQGLYLI